MGPVQLQEPTRAAAARPLCVDLDGTLVKSDTLVDSLLLLARAYPFSALRVPFWLLRGKAALKREVSSRVSLDVANLPYNRPLIAYLTEEKAASRKIYLTTGADWQLAVRVAEFLGLFDEVLASDGSSNRVGYSKLEMLRRRFGDEGFDYVGNGNVDFPLLQHAGEAMLANPAHALGRRLKSKGIAIRREFDDRPAFPRMAVAAMRPHQWAKNVLILVPLLLAHNLKLRTITDAVIAFICFCLCASSAYIVNDLLDLEADRRHPHKHRRPLASGNLSATSGVVVGLFCCALAIACAWFFLPGSFLTWLLLYLSGTLMYSLYLKRIVLIDVIVLSGLYTVRVLAGGGATHVSISTWLAAFSVFLFLSLAMVKRFSELHNALRSGSQLTNGRGYLPADLEQLRVFGTASAYASVVVFALYISGRDMTDLYLHPTRLWLIAPLMLWWLSRIWLLASRGQLHEDPVIFAVTDRVSLLTGVLVVLIGALAAF